MIRPVSKRAAKARLTRRLAKDGLHLKAIRNSYLILNADNTIHTLMENLDCAARKYGALNAMEQISE
jgi:hypothetical protein